MIGRIKRIVLMIVINIAIIATISILVALVESFFGVSLAGNEMGGLLVFAAIVGFSGAFISLMLSRWMAKKIYNIHLIDQHYHDRAGSVVFLTVQDIAHRYHIKMPEVGIYTDDTPNAFATGAHKNAALVAVSTGLLHQMNEDEIKGVVAHEMAHILNGDMVTTTLLQGVLNTFVIFFARVLARLVDTALSKSDNDNGPSFLYYLIVWILEIGLGVLASLILFAHSRHREYKADEGSARMVGKQSMIAALEKLKILTRRSVTQVPQDEYATLKIFGGRSKWYLFQTHPDLDERITHLQKMV